MRNVKCIILYCLLVVKESIGSVKPFFPVTENSEVFVRQGDHIGLKCVPEGDPKPVVSWVLPNSLNSNVIRDHINYHYDNIELEITNMVAELAGTYVCIAHNSAGTASLTYNIRYETVTTSQTVPTPLVTVTTLPPPIIIKPEVFIKQAQYNATEEDKILTIPCAADGLPVPTVTWSAVGTNLPSNAVQYQNFLVIRDLRLDDSRYYLCTATNSAGIAKKSVLVNVRPKPHVKPTTSLSPSNFVNYGETAVLKCTITGYPAPSVKWMFNGKIIAQNTTTYTLSAATMTDIGTYSCSASNDQGNSTSHTVLFVQGNSPQLTQSPTKLVTVTPRNETSLTCKASGSPTPTITWSIQSFSGNANTVKQRLSADNTTLSLPGLTQSVLVRCTASNPFGQVQAMSSVVYMPVVIQTKRRVPLHRQ